MKKGLVAVAVVCAIFGTNALVEAKPRPRQKPVVLQVTDRLGPETNLLPFQDGVASVSCPSGYLATGGGVYEGAIEIAYDGPTESGRGWEAAGINSSDISSYGFEVIVTCAKGSNKNLRVRASLSSQEKRDALRELRGRLGR